MRTGQCRLEGTLSLEDREPWTDYLIGTLGLIPPDLRPKYFSNSERKHKRPEFEVANEARFREHIGIKPCPVLFGDGYELSIDWRVRGRVQLSVLASSLPIGYRLMTEWTPRLDGQLYYANVGVPDEYEHRNGYKVKYEGEPTRYAHGWLGRKIDRYVPGLYWLNYFSQAFAQKHEIDIEALATRTGGRVQVLEKGFILQLYDSPVQWTEWQERIDEVLATTPHFFSKRHVPWPEGMKPRELVKAFDELWQHWP